MKLGEILKRIDKHRELERTFRSAGLDEAARDEAMKRARLELQVCEIIDARQVSARAK